MEQIERGNSVRFTATVRDPDGTLIDVTGETGKVYEYEVEKSSVTPTRISLGTYQWTYTIPSDAALGSTWTVEFSGTVSGLDVVGRTDFEAIDTRT